MADEDESVVIDLNAPDEETQQQAPAPSVGAKPPPVPGPSSSRSSQDGLQDLAKQVEAERNARAQVTRQAQQIAQERDQAIAFAQEAERRGMSVYELNNENQIKAAQDQMDALTSRQEQAYSDGDFKTVAEINRAMARLGGDLSQLENLKGQLANHRAQLEARAQWQREQQQRPQQPQQPQSTDPVERAIHGRTEPTKAFLRKHPELIRGDGSLKRAAIDAHERACDDGFQVDTPGYFEHIERSLMGQQPSRGGGGLPPPRNGNMAAPVERTSGFSGGGGGGNGTFVMTPKMRRLAAEQGVPEKEWAQNYVRLLSEGRVTPIT